MAWFNINDSLNDLKGQLSNFANIVLPDVTDTEEDSTKNNVEEEKFVMKNTEQTSENDTEQNVWSWDSPGTKTDETKTNETISNLKQKISYLENEKAEYIDKLEQLDLEFQDNTANLANAKEKLMQDYNDLEEKYVALQDNAAKIIVREAKYKEEIENLRKTSLKTEENNNVNKENQLLRDKITNLELENNLLKNKNKLPEIETENNLKHNEEQAALIKQLNEKLNTNKTKQEAHLKEIHEKYKKILQDNLNAITNNENFIGTETENNLNLQEFNNIVKKYFICLSEFKLKCVTLEQDLQKVTQEKMKIANEKNHEIEKLLENSEILSQEVITKSNTVKELKHECEELMKNNELLIIELESYKNTSLQTISESNEDNMILLEGQLETATKRIEDLLKQKAEMERKNSIIQEVDDSKETEYDELLNKYNLLEKETDKLKLDNIHLVEEISVCKKEKEHFEYTVEKLKSDLENAEYQFSELNINLESLKDENEKYEANSKDILKIKAFYENNLENNETLQKELQIFKEKYNEEYKKVIQFENEITNYKEKLQNAKIIETTLKLQCDTLNKELNNLNEFKQNVEMNLSKITELNIQDSADILQVLPMFVEKYYQINGENKFLKEQLYEKESLLKCELNKNSTISSQLQELEIKCKEISSSNSQSSPEEVIDTVKNEPDIFINNLLEIKQILKSPDGNGENIIESSSAEQISGDIKTEIKNLLIEKENLVKSSHTVNENFKLLQQQLEEVSKSRNELINIVKDKHEENIMYHNEIQRLSNLLKTETEKLQKETSQDNEKLEKFKEENEKLTDQNQFLREKCEVLASNLLQEQSRVQSILADKSNVSENEIALTKKLERLQSHLLEVEEHYTEELLQSEQKRNELQNKMSILEEKEKQSNTLYTSVNIRANQQVESLHSQLQLTTAQRDELRKKLSDIEDQCNKHLTSVTNLQFVLEQFQKDKENEVHRETERIRKQINIEVQKQDQLKIEIESLKKQLQDSKEGLYAASRLSGQLEHSKHQTALLKEEVAQLQEKLRKTEEKLSSVSSQTDGKIDKLLIKNLIVGLISSNNNLNSDQTQILKIIATVLDFNQQDHDKVKSKQQHGSWLSSLLAPQQGQAISQESLSLAFVKFLENESKPRVIPNLLDSSDTSSKEQVASTPNSRKPSTSNPIVLSEIVLPTFDFAQSRNSSSILKDVMKEKN